MQVSAASGCNRRDGILRACLGASRGPILRLGLAVIPVVLATLPFPAAALGIGAPTIPTGPGTSAPFGVAKGSTPAPKGPQAVAQAVAQAPAEKPVSPPKPPLPRQEVTSAPVVKAPTPTNVPKPALPKAVTPPAGGGRPVDSVATIVKEPVRKVDAVTADPVGTTTKVVQDVQKDASNLVGLIGGGGTPAPPDPVGTTTKVVQDVQKDASNLAGLIGGGGPGADLPQASPSSEPDQLSNLTGIVRADVTIIGTPVRLVDGAVGAVEQAASVWKSPACTCTGAGGSTQSPFAASSFEPRQPPPGAHSGAALPGGGTPSAVGPGPDLGPPGWDGEISDTAQGAGVIPGGDRSSPASRNSASGLSPLASRSLAGTRPGIVSPALQRSGGTFPPIPTVPPMPKVPAMGTGSVSTSLLFGLASALAVVLALLAAQSGFSRRLALEGGRPVGFARLLERPG
jgi:hypothetical protein